ncbi:MAG: hypothetical protein WCP45_17780 [Verrucomicrobiota bacterium]
MKALPILAIKSKKYTIDRSGLDIREELTFEEWQALGIELAPVAKSIGFIIGDWINYGQARYGEKYHEALRLTGLAYETLAVYSHVARRVEFLSRNKNLDFTHHKVVAKVKDPDEQRKWLDTAEKQNLSVARLRKSMNFGRLATEEEMEQDPADRGVVTHLALINRLIRWWKQTTENDPVSKWDPEQRANVKEDFKLILDIYEAL